MIYTNKFINFFSFIITTIIFLILNFYFFNNPKLKEEKIYNFISKIQNHIEDKQKENNETENSVDLGNWYIEIPSINLKAPIEQGTSMEVLNRKVGHFEETNLENGNIGLAAHNRGYEKNYFENLKNVKINDKFFYKHNECEKNYIIDTIEIILNTDWSYLENTEDNKITLITCVENEPKYRRCVQGTQIE